MALSMDGRGVRRAIDSLDRLLIRLTMDNIFIERLWRSLKYEAVYLHDLTDGFHTEWVIGEWIDFYNTERPIPPLPAGRRRRPTGPGGLWI